MALSLVLLALVGCKPDPDDGAFGSLPDADVTWISEGAGPENAGPLEPATAGFRSSTDEDWQRWMGSLDAGRDEVLVKEISGESVVGTMRTGQSTALYRPTRDGLVVHAIDHPLDDETLPVLMVPDTVRVGMEWESEYGDGSVNRMAVVRHETVTLPTGPADAWAIAEFAEENGVTYVSTVRWFAEDVGRIGTSRDDSPWDPSMGYTGMLVPREPQEHSAHALTPSALVGHLEAEDLGQQGWEIWGLSGAVIDGTLFGYVDGYSPPTGFTVASDKDACVRLDAAPAWVERGTVPGCPTHLVYTDNGDYGGFETEVLIDNAAMYLPGVDFDLDLDGAGAFSSGTLTGWVVDGVVHTLSYYDANGYPQMRHITRDTEHPIPVLVADGVLTRGMYTRAANDLRGQRWLGPATAAAGATLHYAVIAGDGRVYRATYADERLSGFLPVGVLPGGVSIMLVDGERFAYSITTDGRLFELRVDQGTGDVSIDALGWVRVEEPGGGYEFKGVIVDPAHPDVVYVAAIATSATSVPIYKTGIFVATLETEPVPLVTPASLMVGAMPISGGIGVCWAPSDDAFDGDGWTLRGEPVDVVGPVGPNGNCAIVVTDWQEPVEPAWVGAAYAIEANVPGVGEVRLGIPDTAPAVGVGLGWALRRDGAIVDSVGSVIGRDGFPIEWKWTYWTGAAGGLPDLGGYGLWIDDRYDSSPLLNVGEGIPTPECPGCDFAGHVLGGGVLQRFATGTDVQAIRPDGSVEVLPAVQTAQMPGGLLLPDGRLCSPGVALRVECVDPSGIVTTTATLEGTLQATSLPFWPLSDGSLLVCSTAPALRFDPADMTLEVLDERSIISPITAPDGQVYGVAAAGDGTAAAVRITPEGTTDLVAVPPGAFVVPIDAGLLVSQAIIDDVWVSSALVPR